MRTTFVNRLAVAVALACPAVVVASGAGGPGTNQAVPGLGGAAGTAQDTGLWQKDNTSQDAGLNGSSGPAGSPDAGLGGQGLAATERPGTNPVRSAPTGRPYAGGWEQFDVPPAPLSPAPHRRMK